MQRKQISKHNLILALKQNDWIVDRAARELDVHRTTVKRLVLKYGLLAELRSNNFVIHSHISDHAYTERMPAIDAVREAVRECYDDQLARLTETQRLDNVAEELKTSRLVVRKLLDGAMAVYRLKTSPRLDLVYLRHIDHLYSLYDKVTHAEVAYIAGISPTHIRRIQHLLASSSITPRNA